MKFTSLVFKVCFLFIIIGTGSVFANENEYTVLDKKIVIPTPKDCKKISDEEAREVIQDNQFNTKENELHQLYYYYPSLGIVEDGKRGHILFNIEVLANRSGPFTLTKYKQLQNRTIKLIKEQSVKKKFYAKVTDVDLSREVIIREDLPFALEENFLCQSCYTSHYTKSNGKRIIKTWIVATICTNNLFIIIDVSSNCKQRFIEEKVLEYVHKVVDANNKLNQNYDHKILEQY